jgi:ferredoxin, 2Fe-2S
MAKVRIAGTSKTVVAEGGHDLLQALQAAGHPISTSCGGRASCGLCRLTVVRGKELLTPLRDEEVHHLGNVARVIGARLACQARICGEGELEVSVPVVDSVELRKRLKAERAARAKRQQRASPSEIAATRAAEPERRAEQKIEWRPRKLAAGAAPGAPTDGAGGGSVGPGQPSGGPGRQTGGQRGGSEGGQRGGSEGGRRGRFGQGQK